MPENPLAKSKGAPILIAKHCPLEITGSLADPGSRYLFLKAQLGNRPVTLIVSLISSFQSGILILEGDFNVPLNTIVDSSTGTSSLTFQTLRQIHTQIHDLLLHDTWCNLHPKEKDYFSAPHYRYFIIYYFFLTQQDLTLLTKDTIEPMFLSDHRPISVLLTFPGTVEKYDF